jgi:CoA transferase family III
MPKTRGTRAAGADGEDETATWNAARDLARSGVIALCGHPGEPPVLPSLSVPSRLQDVVGDIERLSADRGGPVRVCWEAALAGRAALLGLTRRGRTSANGTCRLLDASDGHVALSLPRPDDLDLIPALTSGAVPGDPWDAVARMASRTPVAEFVQRARLLGLAVAAPGERVARHPYLTTQEGDKSALWPNAPWTVVDLSSLWAGPLAARLLAEAGAHVVKVEDPGRPDGARRNPSFYTWIHDGSESSVHIDFRSCAGRKELAEILRTATVVIEASRPRALEQLGLSPEQRGLQPGQVWVSITGHGRSGPGRDWIGFGDDAAIAGGLQCRDSGGQAVFCADAIADPITGLVSALAVLRSLEQGGGQLIDVSLSGVASWIGDEPGSAVVPIVEPEADGWIVRVGGRTVPVAESPPQMRFVERL